MVLSQTPGIFYAVQPQSEQSNQSKDGARLR